MLESNDDKINTISSGSLIALSGFKAEEIFRTDLNIKNALQTYFSKIIISIDKIHGEKYDTKVLFTDGSSLNIQNKKIQSLGGRGDSFDRRHIKDTFSNGFLRKYLTLLTLIRKNKRETFMDESQKKDFIVLCNTNLTDIKNYLKKALIGEDKRQNDYWCIMKTDKDFKDIKLYMISGKKLYDFLEDSLHIDIKPKKNGTCLHLSPYIALQRKGGGNTDHSPNHIQAKLKITQVLLDMCDNIL